MPTVSLASVGTDNVNTASATPINNNFTTLQSAINGLDNQNIAGGAAIVYSKLSLAGSIVNADIATGAAIAIAKLASYPTDGTKALFGDGTWKTVSVSGSTPGTELDYAQITANSSAVTASTEGTSVAIVTGASITYDGTKVKVEGYAPQITLSGAAVLNVVLYRDSTVVGQPVRYSANTATPFYFAAFDTPSAGAHIYKWAIFQTGGTSITINAGAGAAGNLTQAFLRVTKA